LLDWSPSYVFTDTYFKTPEQRDYFFAHICTSDWNEKQDEGRNISVATEELIGQFPDWETSIRDFYGRWTEMLRGPIAGTVDIFRKLKQSGKYKIYALTNWQADLFQIALVRYNFLHWFDGRVVSGEEKMRKPSAAFYNCLLQRYNVDAATAVFIDDSHRNIAGAEAVGIKGIHFQSPEQLAAALRQINIDV
jgi:2-haloacid dehalogenase